MRTIYEPTGRAREYSELALNLYEGCPFGCTYCFNTKTPFVSFEPVIEPMFCISLMATEVFRGMTDEIRIGKLNHDKELEGNINWKDFLINSRAALEGYHGRVIIKKDLLKYGDDTEPSEKTVLAGSV